jgi:copper resistance protein B
MKLKRMKISASILAVFIMSITWIPRAIAADSMSGMDHGSMDMEQELTASTGAMSGMNHGAMKQDADARDPHAYSDGYDFGPIPPPKMADQAYMGSMLVNRLERVRTRDSTLTMYDLMGKFGKDYDKLVLKAEGEVADGKLQDARTELLWGHAIASFWDAQLGMRHDSGTGPVRNWLAFGVQGLAPYWFETEVMAYAGEKGKTALRLAAEYELLFTQKLILQPRAEINLYGKSDPARDIGSGVSDALAGLRLRYEFTRQFAPYAGIEWAGKFGGTADFARATGEKTSETRWVAGVRFWF